MSNSKLESDDDTICQDCFHRLDDCRCPTEEQISCFDIPLDRKEFEDLEK